MASTAPYHTVNITGIKEEARNVKTFTLQPHLPYKAGQFLTFVIQHHGKEERRSFSLSGSPALQEPLSVTVKRVDNGVYSRLLIDRAKVGDELITTGASGLFTLPDYIESYEQIFFFAAGVGITPIYSLLKTVLAVYPNIRVVLIYSSRYAEETVFYKELNELQEQYKDRFVLEYLFSTSFHLSRARLSKQLLRVIVEEYAITDIKNRLFYTCGPFSYMRMVLMGLEEMGASAAQIRKENFNTESYPVLHIVPPDTAQHNITIIHDGSSTSFVAQYPDTILKAAKKHGVNLPYSCDTGRCGSCAVKCTAGKVWMSNNEVLTNDDLAKGNILTCVGYPVAGDITIIF